MNRLCAVLFAINPGIFTHDEIPWKRKYLHSTRVNADTKYGLWKAWRRIAAL